ncbi:MAG TPA: sensor histidine kinase [Methanocella sp.]|uniref:sensor histidine kinase n=1 Tax=Methanocella sp. TaxID=2052833 RepID=UPI002C9D589B|nr:sensor histidine kinase [Methanocella sp.]HTY90954.1 sensor histidine kinase [Methanocella sp.]
MVNFKSIKGKSIIYTLLIALVPVILLGALGTLYFHNVIKQNVQNDYLEESRVIGSLTSNFLGRSIFAMEAQAGRSQLINALDRRDIAALDDQTEKMDAATPLYYWIFVTDTSGRVLSSSPYGSHVGEDLKDSPYITGPLQTGTTFMGPPALDANTGRLTRFVGTPIKNGNSTIGVLVGALDVDQFVNVLQSARSLVPLQSIYLVDSSGRVVFSHDKRYITSGLNFLSLPAVQKVLKGEEGVDDLANLSLQGSSIVAYSPVPGYTMGVLVTIPDSAIDRPVDNATAMIALAVLLLAALATGMAYIIGNYITNPIYRIAAAAKEYQPGMDFGKLLPYDREDELGHLARAFKDMSDRITQAREKIVGEKKRSDLYVDVMGHDINNLNQVILSSLDLAQQTGSLNDRQQGYLKGAKHAVGDSAAIIRNVKAIQVAVTELRTFRYVDLNDVIVDCIKEAQEKEERHINIRYSPQKGRVLKAVSNIERAFCNVIEEAIRNAGSSVDIDVSESKADGQIKYVTNVDDDGAGIPDYVKQTLFTRFQRDSTVPPGKGLNLYAAKVLVEMSGGTIEVRDRVPGDQSKGTRIVITLPAILAGEGL